MRENLSNEHHENNKATSIDKSGRSDLLPTKIIFLIAIFTMRIFADISAVCEL